MSNQLPNRLSLEIAGAHVELLAQRALLWPATKTLFIADLHLGKAGTFRHFGMPIPETAAEDLALLTDLINSVRPERLVVLGDLVHHKAGMDQQLIDTVTDWRVGLRQLPIELIEGNHDRHTPNLPVEWHIQRRTPPVVEAPFTLAHLPPADDAPADGSFTLAGHLHPCFGVKEPGQTRIKCPGFWLKPNALILPAFSRFVDGSILQATEPERMFIVADSFVAELPHRQPRRRRRA